MKHRFVILFLLISANLSAQQKPWKDFNRNGIMDTYENPEAEIDKRVNNLLTISVSLEIQNTGKYDGDEVVQLYLQQNFARICLSGTKKMSL